MLSTAIDLDDATASLPLAFDVAGQFGLDATGARTIAGEVGAAVSTWRQEAGRPGLPEPDRARMSSAFEHRDLRLAPSDAISA